MYIKSESHIADQKRVLVRSSQQPQIYGHWNHSSVLANNHSMSLIHPAFHDLLCHYGNTWNFEQQKFIHFP